MRFLLSLLAFALLALSAPTVSGAMTKHDAVFTPAGVSVSGDTHARDAHAAAVAAAAQSAPIMVPENRARDAFAAAAQTADEPLVNAPLTDPATPWLVYGAITVALLIGLCVLLSSRLPRLHMPHGA